MGDNKVNTIFTAQDKASVVVKQLQKNLLAVGSRTAGPLGGVIGGFGAMYGPAVMAGAAVGALGIKLAQGVRSAIDEERSLASLDEALRANIVGWDGNRDAIDSAIDSYMALGFEDDALRASMVKLVVATKDSEEAIRLQALAMDIARGRNIDLAAATDIVVKANMGNVGALRRMGIQIDRNATASEILAELQKSYGNQAEEYAETTAGAMETAQIAIDEAAESIGVALIPTIKDAAIFVRDDLVPAIDDLRQAAADAQPELDKLGDFFNAHGPDNNSGLDSIFPDLFPQGTNARVDELAWKVQEFFRNLARMGGTKFLGDEGFWNQYDLPMGPPAPPDLRPTLQEMSDQAEDYFQRHSLVPEDFFQRHQGEMGALAAAAGRDTAAHYTDNFADALRGEKDTLKDAKKDFLWVLTHPEAGDKARMKIQGELLSGKLVDALNSADPDIKAAAEQYRQFLLTQWIAMGGDATRFGTVIGNNAENAAERAFRPSFQMPRVGNRGNTRVTDGGRAVGGPTAPGETYLVGERGPELLTMGSRGGNITPNHRLGGDSGAIRVVTAEELARHIDRRQGFVLGVASSSAYVRG